MIVSNLGFKTNDFIIMLLTVLTLLLVYFCTFISGYLNLYLVNNLIWFS